MAGYEYKPVDSCEIRVLRLSPGLEDAPLHGKLEKRRLEKSERGSRNAPTFEATSYVWGGDEKPFSIFIEEQVLPIAASLYSFLRRLRLATKERLLWADAICINQLNSSEKKDQVALMSAIYGSADCVLVDLGEEADDSDLALSLMDRFWRTHIWSGAKVALLDGSCLTPAQSATYIGLDLPDVSEVVDELPDAKDPQWESVGHFFSRSWFSRLWVIQEFVLAREVKLFCGKTNVKWQHLHAGTFSYRSGSLPTSTMVDHGGTRQVAFSCMAILRQIRMLQKTAEGRHFLETTSSDHLWQKFTHCRLVDMLHYFQLSESTLERDRYFALIGIAEDVTDEDGDLCPDYVTPTETVITRFGRFLIRKEYGEEMLMRSGLWQQSLQGVPSWIQDFSGSGVARRVIHLTLASTSYNASGDTKFVVDSNPKLGDVIILRGQKVDIIEREAHKLAVGETLPGQRCSWNDVLEYISTGLKILLTAEPSTTYPTGEHAWDAAWMTMIAYTGSSEKNLKQLSIGFHLISWLAVLHKESNAAQTTYKRLEKHFHIGRNELHQWYTDFCGELNIPISQPLRLSRTRRGYFANLPPCFQPGDEIWIIQGCQMPLLLRKSEDRPGCFHLVGSCYVHGLMNGEALQRESFKFTGVSIH